MLSKEQMRNAIENYARALTAGDVQAIVSLFSEDASFEDPIGGNPETHSGPIKGRAAIAQYFRGMFEYTGGLILMQPSGEVRVARRHAACAFIARMPRLAEPFCMATLDTFEFNDEGLIERFHAYFGEDNRHAVDWVDPVQLANGWST